MAKPSKKSANEKMRVVLSVLRGEATAAASQRLVPRIRTGQDDHTEGDANVL